MNIEVLQDAIRAFRREVIDSGFRRDLDDYESSLSGFREQHRRSPRDRHQDPCYVRCDLQRGPSR